MPTRANSTTVKPANAATTKRFELPALDFRFGSLTEGTDIPPPPPSPKLKPATLTPPKTPKDAPENANGKSNGASDTPPQSTSPGGTKRPANDNPASPTLSTRQGSIRRLFSKNMLNSAYQDGETSPDAARPESRLSTATESKKAKRSSSWFSRLRSSDSAGNKRMSAIQQGPPVPEKKKPSGPPPPMIPELETKFASQEDGLSADLFKDIK
ncbi:hypothetical protein NKR19_g2029 [Coniochaeta hoffmannii]|uniref:Uncharacterized protein n=1 Tax=Coniochaeta hoffmannii TaxID=91930 RepID=A0AA38SBB0_9PEZI|nr:hypothetical protein NKR19_g2029 [Coniochaeta hoffmannii]